MGRYTRITTKNIYNGLLKHTPIVALLAGTIAYNSLFCYTGINYVHQKRSDYVTERLSTAIPTDRGREPTTEPRIQPAITVTVVKSTPIPVQTPTPASNSGYQFPACYAVVTQYYGQNGEAGTDFGCPYRTKLVALWDGVVQYAGRTCWTRDCTLSSGGVLIVRSFIPGLGNESTYYLHIDDVYVGIQSGSRIKKGQYIAYSGGQIYGGHWNTSPAYTEGPHLEIGFDAYFICYLVTCVGTHVNPLPYIREAILVH